MHWVSGATLLAVLGLTITDITGRSTFNRPMSGTIELTSMALVVIVFLAVAHSEDMGDHITIDLVYEQLGKRLKLVLDIFADLFGIAVLTLLSWQLYHFAVRNLASGAETPVLDWPLWPFVMIGSLGTLGYVAATVMKLILRLLGEPTEAKDVTGAAGGIEI
ncbi:MAG: TRAP transporter small permease [Acidimicrobiia bacterium]